MATPETESLFLSSPLFDPRNENAKSHGMSVEKKIDFLESLIGQVSNRRSRRWLNDRLLMELVPRLDADEIRGLFAPPPWGDDVPPSPFCMTNVEEWDKFRNIDMDKQVNIITALSRSPEKRKDQVASDKMAFLNAWRRVDCRTREALRRSALFELIEGYEEYVRAFIANGEEEALSLRVEHPFHRLLLHGVCEFYDLVSVTIEQSEAGESSKTTRITKKKNKTGFVVMPSTTIAHFLRMSKGGV